MQAGKLNSRVKLVALQSGVDTIGQPVEVWTEVATVWAHIKHLNGSQAIKADADTSIIKASIRIRKRDVNAGMRVLHGVNIYLIDAVLPDAAGHEHVDLVCRLLNEYV